MKKLFLYITIFAVVFMICFFLAYRFSKNDTATKSETLVSCKALVGCTVRVPALFYENSQCIEINNTKSENNTTNTDIKEHRYGIFIRNGYVAVFDYENDTIFEYTDIDVYALPEDVKKELDEKQFFDSQEEVFRYLEAISS